MPASPTPLPIGVVVPTRNAMQWLPAHIPVLRALVPHVVEIIVVDSESDDGTPAYFQAELSDARLRILSHPPGLYASWNHATLKVTAPYTYISTVGDPISPEGLRHLHDVITAEDADVVVSPPSFETAPGASPSDEPWPIVEICAWLGVDAPTPLPSDTAFWLAVFYMPQAVLGSAASNLFRTSFLQGAPFPDDCGGAGDTAWTLAHGLRARFAITPRTCATYLFQPGSAMTRKPPAGLMGRLRAIAAGALHGHTGTPALKALAALLERADLEAAKKEVHKRVLLQARDSGLSWIASPAAWRARSGRNRQRRAIKGIHAEIETLVRETLPPTPAGWSSSWRAPLWRYG